MPTTHGGPATDCGKAISRRNATTHGVFARDVVLPALGEDPEGYAQLQAEWTKQLVPRNLLEQHYVEKIAAASWRLRRLHRWQAQIFEDPMLTEAERLERLTAVLRHETALQRQIDTAVKLLAHDVPQLYQRRLRDQVLEDLHVTERECRDEAETDLTMSLETGNRLYQLRKATTQAANELSEASLDAVSEDTGGADTNSECQNEPAHTSTLLPFPLREGKRGTSRGRLPFPNRGGTLRSNLLRSKAGGVLAGGVPALHSEICRNEPAILYKRLNRRV